MAVVFAFAMLCTVLANILPDGRLKMACSYVGVRALKAIEVYRAYAPAPAPAQPAQFPAPVPVQIDKDGAR